MPTSEPTVLTSGSSTNDGPYVTASVSPTADRLIIAIIAAEDADQTPPTPTCAGNGFTWTNIATERVGADSELRATVFVAKDAAPTPGTITFTFSDTMTDAAWIIAEVGNIDTTLTASAIVRQIIAANAFGSSVSATLAAFANSDNSTIGIFAHNEGVTPTWTPGSGFTQISEVNAAGISLMLQWKAAADTDVEATISGTEDIMMFAAELEAVLSSTQAPRSRHYQSMGTMG